LPLVATLQEAVTASVAVSNESLLTLNTTAESLSTTFVATGESISAIACECANQRGDDCGIRERNNGNG